MGVFGHPSNNLRSGFAAGVAGDGGYADVKLLLYADLGKHVAFDGTAPWLMVTWTMLSLQRRL